MASREMTEITLITEPQDIEKIVNSETTIFIAVDIENTNTGEYAREMRQIRRDDLLAFCASSLGDTIYNGLDYTGGQGNKMLDAMVGQSILNSIKDAKDNAIKDAAEDATNKDNEVKKYVDQQIQTNITAVLNAKY